MTIIASSYVVIGKDFDSSIEIGAEAGKGCMEMAETKKSDINLLINVGVMRDQNIVEPAIAPLIQKRMKLNLSPSAKRLELGKKTLSFDLLNSACGFLNAVHVIDSFFKNNNSVNVSVKGNMINKAIIVASEVHPSGEKKPDFPFTHSGAAMLLEPTISEGAGFKSFMFNTTRNGYSGMKSYCNLEENANNSRNIATVIVDENYERRLEEFTLITVQRFLSTEKIELKEISLVICSQPSPSFVRIFSKRFQIEEELIFNVHERYGDTYSAALIIGYHIAMEESRVKKGNKVLFISGGAGLTVACALYQA